jgi:hypothetical protein
VSGQVTDSAGAPDPHAAVIVFPADSNVWQDGVFTNRRTRMVRTTSTGAFDVATLAPGDYFIAATDVREALNWQDAEWLTSLVARASRISLGAEDQRTVTLRTLTPTGAVR